MSSRLTETIVDCADPAALAEFWCAALDYVVAHADDSHGFVEIAPQRTDAELLEAVRRGPVPPSLIFVRVPEGKVGKNRLHLDLSPIDRSHAEEVDRLLTLGATRADIGQSGEQSWVVLADPEGNEFCVLRSLAPAEFSS